METNEPEMAQDATSSIGNGLKTVLSFDSVKSYEHGNGSNSVLRSQSASNSPSKPPALKLAHSADEPSNSHDAYGVRRRTRTNDRPELTRTVSASSNISPPTLVRKASENAMMLRELNSSGSPPVYSHMRERRLSRNNTPRGDLTPTNISPTSSVEIPNNNNNNNGNSTSGGRYNLMSGAYQRTSQSAGNLILSRPTTPTLEAGSPRGNNSRSGSPDQGNMLPRSASDQTPKKKSVEDFHIGKVLGEGSYGAVCNQFHFTITLES